MLEDHIIGRVVLEVEVHFVTVASKLETLQLQNVNFYFLAVCLILNKKKINAKLKTK